MFLWVGVLRLRALRLLRLRVAHKDHRARRLGSWDSVAPYESMRNWLRSSREVLAQLGDEQRDRAMEECPLGMLMADILRMLACFDRQEFPPLSLVVVLGDAGQDWYQPAVDVAYGPELAQQWRSAALECPLGFAAANLIKAMLCSHTESICFRAHEQMMGAVLEEIPLPEPRPAAAKQRTPRDVAASGWPIIRLLGHVSRVVRRHGFDLDFLPGELLKYPEAEVSRSMQDLHVALPPLRRAADATAARWKGLRLVYASMAHGPRGGDCRWRPSILNKFTLPLVLLHEHFDVFWLDLDVFLFQRRREAPSELTEHRPARLRLLPGRPAPAHGACARGARAQA
eukprot:g4991.t1